MLCRFVLILVVSAAAQKTELTIEGNEFHSDRLIKNTIPPLPDSTVTSELVLWRGRASNTVRRMYRESGFLDISIDGDVTEQPTEPDEEPRYRIRITITEGPRYFIDTTLFELTDTSAPFLLPSSLNSVKGEPFAENELLQDRRDIASLYADAGFMNVEVVDSAMLREDTALVTIRFVIDPDEAVVADTIWVRSVRSGIDTLSGLTSLELLNSLMPYNPGDTVKATRNDNVIEKLQSTGLYTSVRLNDTLISVDGEEKTALILEAAEKTPGRFSTGISYETQYGPGLSAAIEHSNIGGRMHEVGGGFELALNKQSFRAHYGTPLLFGLLLRFDADFETAWYQLSEYHRENKTPPFSGDFETKNTTSLSRAVNEWFRYVISGELLTRDIETEDVDQPTEASLNLLSTGFFTFTNDRINPTLGSRYSATWGNGGALRTAPGESFFGGRHNWLEAQTAYYYPAFLRLNLAARLNGGRFFGGGGINSERFFLGGPRSVRSFGFQELCPSENCAAPDDDLTPAYVLTSAEIRFTILDTAAANAPGFVKAMVGSQIVPFFDYGNVWDVQAPFLESDLGEGFAYGIGLRYPLLNIFTLRLDFAWGRRGTGESAFAWILDLAQTF
jgi:outer membrane protein assembly factor BamA